MRIDERLADIRQSIEEENVSYGELIELAGLAEHIDPSDVLLLQWAGVPEFPDDECACGHEVYAHDAPEGRCSGLERTKN